MNQFLFLALILISIERCSSWMSTLTLRHNKFVLSTKASNDDGLWDESMKQQHDNSSLVSPTQVKKKNSNPCWQDIYDDDCSMSTIYSASFVAMDWIKDLPCAKGKDCIPPKSLTTPVAHGDGGIQKADVMGMLGLKRAKPLK